MIKLELTRHELIKIDIAILEAIHTRETIIKQSENNNNILKEELEELELIEKRFIKLENERTNQ